VSHAPLAALRHRDFRIFWTGLVLSGIGSQFSTVAMAWQIYELTNSPLHIGLLGLARAVPHIGLLLFGGLLADAVDRRWLMLVTQGGQFVVSAGLVALALTDSVSPLALYAASMLFALSTSLETPARQSLVPNLVPPSALTSALALNSTQRQVSIIAGPSVAGIALAFSGPALCYAVDALSWLAMIGSLFLLRAPTQPVSGPRPISLNSLKEGIGFVWSHPVILSFMALDFGMSIFGSTRALLPIFARDILGAGPEGLGILYSASAAGSLIAAAAMGASGHRRRAGLWVFSGVAVYGFATSLFAVSQTFWFSVLMLAAAGAGNTVGAVLRHTINQITTPDDLRGRVASVNSVFTSGGPQLGQFESGLVAAYVGARTAALVGGLATLALVAGLAASAPFLRRFEIKEETLPAGQSQPA